MKRLSLGDSGAEVSALCLGCMYFGTRVDEQTAFRLLDRYFEAGGRFLDTSNNYAFWVDGGEGGESESLLGRWLEQRGNRDEVFLATKVGANPSPTRMSPCSRIRRSWGGAFTRTDRPLPEEYAGPDSDARLTALHEVANATGATPNQVVLAWLHASAPAAIPLIAASTEAQLAENLAALDVQLQDGHLRHLSAAWA